MRKRGDARGRKRGDRLSPRIPTSTHPRYGVGCVTQAFRPAFRPACSVSAEVAAATFRECPDQIVPIPPYFDATPEAGVEGSALMSTIVNVNR